MVLRPSHAPLPLLPGLDSQNHLGTHRRHSCLVSDKSFNAKLFFHRCRNCSGGDLTNALLHPLPASPLSPISDSQHAALQQLSTIFHEITDPGPTKIPTMIVAKTPTFPPVFEPLPIPIPAALPRVPSPRSTTPSPLSASLPRVQSQPRPPAPPAPAVDALPESPTETYQARTSNAGQRRRQRHKAQRAATKQASKQNKKNESTTSRPTTRSVSNPSKPKKRHGTKITSHTVNHVSSVFAKPPPSHPTPIPEPINHSSMPAHACPCLLDRERRP